MPKYGRRDRPPCLPGSDGPNSYLYNRKMWLKGAVWVFWPNGYFYLKWEKMQLWIIHVVEVCRDRKKIPFGIPAVKIVEHKNCYGTYNYAINGAEIILFSKFNLYVDNYAYLLYCNRDAEIMDDWTELINIQYQAKKLSMHVITPRALKPIRTEGKKETKFSMTWY